MRTFVLFCLFVCLFVFFLLFFFAFHFWKWRKFVLGLPKSEFSTGKKHFTSGKKIRKNYFAPSEKYACYAPVPNIKKYTVTSHPFSKLDQWHSNRWARESRCPGFQHYKAQNHEIFWGKKKKKKILTFILHVVLSGNHVKAKTWQYGAKKDFRYLFSLCHYVSL